ncbi:hypothetical protein [Nocardioides limicola]|uniref:hypothetical protein n=1 Tax=Nocardioides limicola TaxID=2803368 RepID=UPI00193B829A|nr:hypothetical protein [Nocardioides sp. DJM-14]
MKVERVQKWVMSALLLTTLLIFAGGLVLLADSSEVAGAKPGLLVLATIVGVGAVVGVRIINQLRILTPWLLLGLLPAAVGVWLHYLA